MFASYYVSKNKEIFKELMSRLCSSSGEGATITKAVAPPESQRFTRTFSVASQ